MPKLILLLLLIVAGACQAQRADLLVYEVKEEGLAPYLSRILVTDAFVRLDEGEGSSAGFTLYNRVSHRIYNVDAEDETVLVLQPPDIQPSAPADLKLEQTLTPDREAPRVAGKQPALLILKANGKVCRRLQVLPGAMPRAVQALRELRLALARLQGDPDPYLQQDPCALAALLYAPARHLAHGLPLVDLMQERRQVLVNFQTDQPVPDDTFQVPDDYRQVVPPPLEQQ
jgi:hypothetical protein